MKVALTLALCLVAACTKKTPVAATTPVPVVETTSGHAEPVESIETTQAK